MKLPNYGLDLIVFYLEEETPLKRSQLDQRTLGTLTP